MDKAERKPISMREGKAFINGEQILDAIKLNVVFTPETTEYRTLGQRGKSRRWQGYDLTGSISQYKATPFYKDAVKKYTANGVTPTMTITGITDDPASDYGAAYGSETVTLTGVVITGDIPLIDLDAEGELVIQEIEIGAAAAIL